MTEGGIVQESDLRKKFKIDDGWRFTSEKCGAPMAITSSHQSMIDDLKKLDGDDFTRLYHQDQEDAHEDAMDLFKRYGSNEGENAGRKAWAAKT